MTLNIPPDTWMPPFVTLNTTMGTFSVELYWQHAPLTCKNFAELARRGYYNNCAFFRIIRNFIIQSGDPTSTGRSKVSIYGQLFKDEINDDLKFTGAGIIASANSGPNSNSSQFFITLAPTPWLDGQCTIFGRVNSGMTVVKNIGLVEVSDNETPIDSIVIKSAIVEEGS